MARLQTVLDAVQTNITVFFPTTKYRTGEKYLTEKVHNPRVVWVPDKDDYAPVSNGGHTRPRSVKTRRAVVLAHCFHDDFGQTEELVNAAVYSMHTATAGSYAVDFGDWSDGAWLEKGFVCTLRFLIDIPITAPTPTVTTPTTFAFDTSTTVKGDGYIDAGEST